MTTIVCDWCAEECTVEGMDEVAVHPSTDEALCPDCAEVRCHHCERFLDVDELTSNHVHESGPDTFVCDVCPRVEFPHEFDMTFRREVEGYAPSWMDEIYPNVEIGGRDHNADALPRNVFRWTIHATFRMNSRTHFELVEVNGERLDDE